MKKLFLALFLIYGISTPVASQSALQARQIGHFSIRPGSSFEASESRSQVDGPSVSRTGKVTTDLAEALAMIRSHYAGKAPAEALIKSAISGSLSALDPHSNYFDAKEFREFIGDQESEYSGIGATLSSYKQNGKFNTYVLASQAGSPADAVRLEFGDRLTAVNGVDVSNMDSEEVRDLVRGDAGTVVRLRIEKVNGDVKEVRVRRASLEQRSIPSHFLVQKGIGYVAMTEGFAYSTGAELKQALKDLKAQGMKEVIIDLRGNPGGLLDQAVESAEQFLPAGTLVVSQRGRKPFDNREWRSKNRNPEKMSVVLLVDRNSASASEILAGALQDHDRALIVGERTFGKGLVQNVINLPAGGGLALTSARYYTPSGRCIQRDYSSKSEYEYFSRKAGSEPQNGRETRTDAQRVVFGGNGIQPDELVSSKPLTPSQVDLIDATFHFSRAYFREHSPGQLRQVSLQGDSNAFPQRDALLSDFRRFVESSGQNSSAIGSVVNDNADFIVDRISYYLFMAARVPFPDRAFLAHDPVIQRAIEILPRAGLMAKLATYDGPNSDLPAPRVFKRKQPAGSHNRRAENRRN